MSREMFQLVQKMNVGEVDTQLILQCAPVITRLKISNLLIIQKSKKDEVIHILKNTDISYYVLFETNEKITFLLYHLEDLQCYLQQSKVKFLLKKLGYLNNNLKMLLKIFQNRYKLYMIGKCNFPHEVGLFLGYPVEDVNGFIKYGGKNSLHTGYWKIYDNASEKIKLFQKYDQSKAMLMKLLSNGISINKILDMYRINNK